MKSIVQNVAKDITTDLLLLDDSIKNRICEKDVAVSMDAKENEIFHGTWQMEKMMLSYIEAGDTAGIRRFFRSISKQETIYAGILAENPLRQEKNLFIGLVALIGKTAGIAGGMDIEDAYRLIDVYTRECEMAVSVKDVHILRYSMVMEFTERVRKCRLPQNLSIETVKAIHYINEHIYSDVSLDEVANHVGISRSTLTKRFRREINQSIVEYVTGEKIKEAQRLLLYSNMTIGEIALYLNFSSQPYFHTIFKKSTGYTPLEWQRNRSE